MKSYIPFLSLRYLWFHKISSGLGILGVTLGVGLVIVVVGVMDGFQTRLKRSLVENTTAVVVEPFFDLDSEVFVEELKKRVPGVLEASPVVQTMTAVAPRDGKADVDGMFCQVIGIDAARENRVSGLEGKLRRRNAPGGGYTLLPPATPDQPFLLPEDRRAAARRLRPEKQGVVLGRGLLTRLRTRLGGEVQVYSANLREEQGKDPELRLTQENFVVTGVYDSEDYDFNRFILMDRRDAVSFFRSRRQRDANQVRLLIADPDDCDRVKKAIENATGALVAASLRPGGRVAVNPIEVKTWKDIHETTLAAVANEKGLLIVITGFSFIVVAFLIGSTQSMLVVEKTREIGVLRSLGSSVPGTAAVFVGNGFFIGTFGAFGGWAVGTAITSRIHDIVEFLAGRGMDVFPESIYRFRDVPIHVGTTTLVAICGGAVAFSLLGSLLPAVRAAMLDPVRSLHHE